MKRLVAISNLSALLILIGFTSCKKEQFVGPDVESIYGNLVITETLSHDKPNGVDFSLGEQVNFAGKFNISADIKLEINGLTSNAAYVTNTTSSDLAADGINWDGSSQATFFKSEFCEIILTFAASEDTLRDTVFVLNTKDFSSEGYLLNNFETDLGFSAVGNTNTSVSERQSFPIAAAEGQFYYTIAGDEQGGNYWLGAIRFVGLRDSIGGIFSNDEIYFNAFYYGQDLPGTRSIIRLIEDEDGDGNEDERWEFSFYPTDPIWSKNSFKFSDATVAGAESDGVLNPSNIMQIDITLSTDGSTSTSSPSHGYSIDFPIITYGAPL